MPKEPFRSRVGGLPEDIRTFLAIICFQKCSSSELCRRVLPGACPMPAELSRSPWSAFAAYLLGQLMPVDCLGRPSAGEPLGKSNVPWKPSFWFASRGEAPRVRSNRSRERTLQNIAEVWFAEVLRSGLRGWPRWRQSRVSGPQKVSERFSGFLRSFREFCRGSEEVGVCDCFLDTRGCAGFSISCGRAGSAYGGSRCPKVEGGR